MFVLYVFVHSMLERHTQPLCPLDASVLELTISLINSCLNCCSISWHGQSFYTLRHLLTLLHMSTFGTVPQCLDIATEQ